MTIQQFIEFCKNALASYELIGDFLSQEVNLGNYSFTLVTALSSSLVLFLSVTLALHIIHLVNPLG